MIKKFCARCDKDTWWNPLKRANKDKEQEYRCTGCGFPIRTGGNAKNVAKVGMKVKCFGPGEPVR